MNKEKKQGSILAYSLVVISVMIAIAGTLSVVAIVEKKGASGTEFSMQSLQTADSGVQLALKKMDGSVGTITQVFASFGTGCSDDKVINTNAGPDDSSYELTFFNDAGAQLACGANKSEIANIKSVGTYKNTVRAVNVAVAATETDIYQTSCYETGGSFSGEPNTFVCCQIKRDSGLTTCKYNIDRNNTWSSAGTPFAANATLGKYDLTCGSDSSGYGMYCCRTNVTTGGVEKCVYNDLSPMTTWSAFGTAPASPF
ncbi:MAG: hypothetical protein PHP62_01585 [Candidatus Moranbacteria bacterium]|nr:hypothetical protein [Candidatus Moranbacteria bacterium]